MSIFDLSSADIAVPINTHSVRESNLFLRRFYNELATYGSLAWFFCPSRNENTIHLGKNNFGEMWLDYEVKGCIKNVYFKTFHMEHRKIVKDALEKAARNESSFRIYDVRIELEPSLYHFSKMCKKGISIFSSNQGANIYRTSVTFRINAYGEFDLNYILTQKQNYLLHLLCAYSNYGFKINKRIILTGKVEYTENTWSDYDLGDVDGIFLREDIDDGATLLPDFFDLFNLVLENDYPEKELRLILNSAQQIYCGFLLREQHETNPLYVIPGFADIINTTFISALEPLSNINTLPPEKCKHCGNTVYKISSRIKDLCLLYLPEHIVKEMIQKGYSSRSSFLHEGNAYTNEFYCGKCVPLINLNKPNEMYAAIAAANTNLTDYVLYVFRRKVHDFME